MVKFPYVNDYKLFERVDLTAAKELLDEYKDFYEYNRTQVAQNPGANTQDTFGAQFQDEEEARLAAERLEHNRGVCVDHFEKHFGCKDFAEACMVGMKIDFYELQKILLSEHRNGIPITVSALNAIAPKLRVLASTLLFAERIVSGLARLADREREKASGNTSAAVTAASFNKVAAAEKAELAVDFAKEGFLLLLERQMEKDIDVPIYHSNKKELKKLKTVEEYIDFCEKLFFANESLRA